jgi:hypothetical protein
MRHGWSSGQQGGGHGCARIHGRGERARDIFRGAQADPGFT